MTYKEFISKQLRGSLHHYIVDIYLDEVKMQPLPYQRGVVWNEAMKVAFIESLLLNIPVGATYLLKHNSRKSPDEPNYEIIDGLQRITSVREFFSDKLQLNNLQTFTEFNGCYYRDIMDFVAPSSVVLPAFVLDSSYASGEDIRRVFRLVNSQYAQMSREDFLAGVYASFHSASDSLLRKDFSSRLIATIRASEKADISKLSNLELASLIDSQYIDEVNRLNQYFNAR